MACGTSCVAVVIIYRFPDTKGVSLIARTLVATPLHQNMPRGASSVVRYTRAQPEADKNPPTSDPFRRGTTRRHEVGRSVVHSFVRPRFESPHRRNLSVVPHTLYRWTYALPQPPLHSYRTVYCDGPIVYSAVTMKRGLGQSALVLVRGGISISLTHHHRRRRR